MIPEDYFSFNLTEEVPCSRNALLPDEYEA